MRPLLITLLLCCSTMAQAAIQTREVPYTAADGTAWSVTTPGTTPSAARGPA